MLALVTGGLRQTLTKFSLVSASLTDLSVTDVRLTPWMAVMSAHSMVSAVATFSIPHLVGRDRLRKYFPWIV
jgi:hypothetical protein